jgi:hypothetical protein
MRLRAPLNEMTVTWAFGATSDDPRLAGVVHRGVDLRAAVGTPCRAAADGAAVALSQYDMGFGRYMRLGLGEVTLDGWDGSRLMGNVVVYYAHLIKRTPSQPVQRGAVIGWTGETGFCLGAHLHWEVRVDGMPVDPMLYVEGAMDALERTVGEMREASKLVRWTMEDKVVRAIQRARANRFEAIRLRNQADALDTEADSEEQAAYACCEKMVSTVDGIAYRPEILGGGGSPPDWEG